MDFTTDNIDNLRAWRLASPGGWRIAFRSTNAAMCHQLYVNGRLADWTEGTGTRTFTLPPNRTPRQVIIAAVVPHLAGADFSKSLPAEARRPAFVYRTQVLRWPQFGSQSRLELVGDHATGAMDDEPLATAEGWPASKRRWGFGHDTFGSGGMGLDGSGAPGLSGGTFGGGPFGADADSVELSAALAEEGSHRLAVRVVEPDGRSSQGPVETFVAYTPPTAVRSAEPVEYDSQEQLLTLQIER